MRICNLEKTVGNFHLKIDDLYIEPGKIHGILGHNGSGKTVLLKLMMGILKPDAGSIDYEGLRQQDMTMMTQRPYLLQTSVYENLVYPLKLRGIRPDEKTMDGLLERVGLLANKKQYARSLSSGERQKLSFLRALVFEPKLIIIDETLSNLDPESEKLFEQMIQEIQQEKPITWLIVNHQIDRTYELCDQIHRMEKGRMLI